MASYRCSCAIMAAVLTLSTGAAMGQGIPVIDQTAIAKHMESIAQLKSQLDALHQQIEKAEELYTSFNKLTDMADVAKVLNDPAIRKALPPEFAAVEGLFEGNGSGALNDAATKFLDKNTTYKTSADDFTQKNCPVCRTKMPARWGSARKFTTQQQNASKELMNYVRKFPRQVKPRKLPICKQGFWPSKPLCKPMCCAWKACAWFSRRKRRLMISARQKIGAVAWMQ